MSQSIAVSGNSEDKDQPKFSERYRPHTPEPERAIVAKPLITTDKDNWSKTLLRNGYVMSVVDLDAVWSTIEKEPPYRCLIRPEYCKFTTLDPEAFIGHYFQEVYRVNMPNEDGLSREQFVRVTMTPYAIGITEDESGQKRMKEGARH